MRPRPAGQQRLVGLGRDARYARGRDGTEAWVTNDVDQPARLVIRDPAGATLAAIRLLDLFPPRTLVDAAPLLESGLSITADGSEVWLTMVDRDTTEHVPRLLRWRRGDRGLTELRHDLGPGGTVDPTGATYYYSDVDGDRWRLAAWDARRGTRRILIDAPPGTYVLGAQVSPDGARLIADVWDGTTFVAWVLDAASGARLSEIRGAGTPGAPSTPIWDASFTDDGRVMYLGVVDGRFQVFVDGVPVTDAPYAVLAARSARGTIRFLNREGWNWTVDEVAVPPVRPPDAPAIPLPRAPTDAPPSPPSTPTDAPPSPRSTPTDAQAALPDATSTPQSQPPGTPSTAQTPVASTPPTVGAAAPPATTAAAPATTAAPPATTAAPPATTAAPPVTTPASPLSLPAGAPAVLSDTSYSPWEYFFFPQLRMPNIVQVSSKQTQYGILLGGGDRLGMQRWNISAEVQLPGDLSNAVHGGGDIVYLNTMLAPWHVLATAGFVDWVDPVTMDGSDVQRPEERRTRDASLSISRIWRESITTTLSGLYTDDHDRPPDLPGLDRRLAGPGVACAGCRARQPRIPELGWRCLRRQRRRTTRMRCRRLPATSTIRVVRSIPCCRCRSAPGTR